MQQYSCTPLCISSLEPDGDALVRGMQIRSRRRCHNGNRERICTIDTSVKYGEYSPLYREELRHFHGKHHVTIYLQLARHKGFHGILSAFCDGSPVGITDSKGDIRLFNPARDKVTHAVVDLECPYTGFFSCNIPLQDPGHIPGCRGIKSASQRFEKFAHSHCCHLLLTH